MTHDAIRQQLQARVSELMRRNDKVERSRRREHMPLEGDWKEDAIVRENDDVLEVLDVEGREQLVQLQAALRRLDEGSYGVCVTCEGPIVAARLAAAPELTTCIACAMAAEHAARR
jgi:RNA polymerase-binding transcription factor DksA